MTVSQWVSRGRWPGRGRERLGGCAYAAAGKVRVWLWVIFRYMLVIGISFIILYPLLIKLGISVMSRGDMNDLTVRLIARHPTLDNYKFVFEAMNYPTAILNSLGVGVVCTVLQMATCCLSSYAFVRLRFPGSRFFFLLAVFTLVVPPETYMVAMYSQFQQLGLLNTVWPLFIKAFFSTGIRNGLYIFLMTQFFRNVPIELEEAAHVDGAGPLRIFRSVVLPNSIPILVTVAVFSFVWQWNDEFFSGLLAQGIDFVSNNLYNINVKISVITGQYTDDHAYLSILKNAASVLTVAPLLLLFLTAQKFFVENLERSGIVG